MMILSIFRSFFNKIKMLKFLRGLFGGSIINLIFSLILNENETNYIIILLLFFFIFSLLISQLIILIMYVLIKKNYNLPWYQCFHLDSTFQSEKR